MIGKNILIPTAIFVLSLSTISLARTETTVTTSPTNLNDVAAYQGPRARIAVADFECKAAKCSAYHGIGYGLADMLTTSLFQSGRFIVLESASGPDSVMRDLKNELEFSNSGYVENGKGPEKGLMEGADLLITGTITAFDPDTLGGKGSLGGSNRSPSIFGNINIKSQEAYIAADIRLIDIRTRRIVNATRVEGTAKNLAAGGKAGGTIERLSLSGSLSGYQNTPMEQAIMIMINDAVNSIASLTPESYYRYGQN